MASITEVINKIRASGLVLEIRDDGSLKVIGKLTEHQKIWIATNKADILAALKNDLSAQVQEQIALIREVLSDPISDLGEIKLEKALVIGHLENSVLISLNEQQEWVATDSGKWFLNATEKQCRQAQESLWEGYSKKTAYSLAEWLIASCTTPLACLEITLLQMIQRREVHFVMDKQTGQWMPIWQKYEAQRQQEAA